MIANDSRFLRVRFVLGGLLAGCLLPCAAVSAQDGSDGAYRNAENSRVEREAAADRSFKPGDTPADAPLADGQNTGPVRLARFAYVSGNVTWRTDDKAEWSKATVNLPIRQDAQIWVTQGGHADVQFDDGSELRLGNGALATLKTLFSDKDGEFTQISLSDGLATLYSRHDNAVYQVDTPAASVKSKGAAQIRFGVDSGSEVTIQRGEAAIEGPQGTTTLHQGDYLYVADSSSPLKVRAAPAPDSWDRWNDERNRVLEGKGDRHVPSNIGLVSGELDNYGDWHNDPAYGWVWSPRGMASDWRPYYDGNWTWVDPFGWTWVANEPWGWAPYHYGTWVHLSYGWGWCPGPLHQYWSPGVVSFSDYNGYVAWAPLCPWEVHYPSALSFGFWGRNWGFSFSIGCAGVYYPFGGYCVGRPWNSFYVNHFDRFRDHDHEFGRGIGSPSFNRFARSSEFAAANSHFVPYNASHFSGATFARVDAFGGRGRYQALSKGDTSYFARGRYAAAPGAGRMPLAGPPSVAPTSLSRTPTRTFATGAQPSQAALHRDLYHAPASGVIGRDSRSGIGAGGVANRTIPSNRTASPSILGSRANAPGGTTRIGIDDGRVLGQSSRPADTRGSAADAARQARASLGMGGGRASVPYGGASRVDSAGRDSGRSGSSGGSDRFGSAGRAPSNGGAYGRSTDSTYGSTQPRTYGGSGSGTSSSRTYGGGTDYGTGSYHRYSGGDYRSGSSPSGGVYSSGRSRGDSGGYSSGGRPGSPSGGYSSGRSSSPSSGGYSGGRSGSPSGGGDSGRSGGGGSGGGRGR